MATCRDPAPPLLWQGVHEFNAGEYFECHETLETLWLQEPGPVRELYQGILQVGVALYKHQRGQYRGAVRLLQRGLVHLAPFGAVCHGLDVARLVRESEQVLRQLVAVGPAGMGQIGREAFPSVHWVDGPHQ